MPSESRSRKGWRKTARFDALRRGNAARIFGRLRPAAFFGGDFQQIRGDDVDIAFDVNGDILELRVEGDGHVGRDGPGRGGPDEAEDFAPGERGIDRGGIGRQRETHPDGGAGVIGVFDLGFGQRGAIVHAPVDRLEAFVDVAAIEKLDERAGDDRLILRAHGEIGIVPAAEHAEALEIVALEIDVLFRVLAARAADLHGRHLRLLARRVRCRP